MAGFVADERQWRKFEKRASRLFARFRVDVFHTIDVRRSDKDFEGWKVDRKIKFLDEFQHIINETLEHGVAAILREDDYAYYLGLPWPKKARKDSRYALLFRACMADFIDMLVLVQIDQASLRSAWRSEISVHVGLARWRPPKNADACRQRPSS
jgi:hypothetical protein